MYLVWLDDRYGDPLVHISHDDWPSLSHAIKILQAKTGIQLDPYSDTRIYPDHAQILTEAVENGQHVDDASGN
jgi:hypothetical protein